MIYNYPNKQDLLKLLAATKQEALSINPDQILAGLSETEIQKINTDVQKDIRARGIDFARQMRVLRRKQIALIKQPTPADEEQIVAQIQELRSINREILSYMPNILTRDAVVNLRQKKAEDEHMRQLGEKENERINNPLDLETKILGCLYAPILAPTMAILLWWHKKTQTPEYKAKQQEKFRKAFRKHWRELHQAQEKKSAAFRKLYRDMHQKQ